MRFANIWKSIKMYNEQNEHVDIKVQKRGFSMEINKYKIRVQVVPDGKWYEYKRVDRDTDFKKAKEFALESYKNDLKGSME